MNKALARENERQKYLKTSPGYGSTNHGKGAYDAVMALKPKVLIDFGCGGNQFCTEIRRRGVPTALGLDFANPAADLLRPMHDTELQQDYADIITSFDAMEHLIPYDVHTVLAEMKRVAKPSAAFVFSISYKPSRILVDGENLHPTVRDEGWWVAQINWYGELTKRGRYLEGFWS